MREKLRLHLDSGQYGKISERYHFEESGMSLLQQVGSLTEKAAEPVLYYAPLPEHGNKDERLAVIVTLGSGVDELQCRYTDRGRLTEGYMVECIAMELLKAAYEQAAERIHARMGKWISGFEFVGDLVPFDRMAEIFCAVSPEEVGYNQAYMLSPKKTVVFLTSLCQSRKDSYCHVCEHCGCPACPDRIGQTASAAESRAMSRTAGAAERRDRPEENLTYGYQRIFGEKG